MRPSCAYAGEPLAAVAAQILLIAKIAEKLATAKRGKAPGPNPLIHRLTQPQAAKATGTTVTNISLVRTIKAAKREDLLKLGKPSRTP